MLGSPEYFQKHGGSNAAFVDAVYADMLQRPSDSGGAAYYGSLLTQGKSRAEVAQLVLRSTEAKQVLVHGFYQTYLHRPVDPGGLDYCVNLMMKGVKEDSVIVTLVTSEEYSRGL